MILTSTRRWLVASLVIASWAISGPVRAQEAPITAVVELFTSQGCSSCPPADALLSELADRPGILALAFHVDYWDYLGWEDTFASPTNSKRQRLYAESHGERSVYTPQMIVNGTSGLVGSDRTAVEAELEAAQHFPLDVETTVENGMLKVHVAGDGTRGNDMASVYVLQVSEQAQVTIKRGENAGTTRDFRNIVRDIMPIGVWDGGSQSYKLPLSDVEGPDVERLVVLVQTMNNGKPAALLGAATCSLLGL